MEWDDELQKLVEFKDGMRINDGELFRRMEMAPDLVVGRGRCAFSETGCETRLKYRTRSRRVAERIKEELGADCTGRENGARGGTARGSKGGGHVGFGGIEGMRIQRGLGVLDSDRAWRECRGENSKTELSMAR